MPDLRQEPTLPSAEEVERTLGEVLSRPEFAAVEEPLLTRWFNLLWDWISRALGAIWDFISDLFPEINPGPGMAALLRWTLYIGAGAAALFLLYYIWRLIRGAWKNRESKSGVAGSGFGDGAVPRDANGWEALSRSLAEAARWREAALALYQSVVRRLGESEIIRFDPSKTPGDYRLETQVRPEVNRPFTRFVRLFEPIAFSHHPVDGIAYSRLRAVAQELGTDG